MKKEDIENYYNEHSFEETALYFKVGKKKLTNYFEHFNIPKKTKGGQSRLIKNHDLNDRWDYYNKQITDTSKINNVCKKTGKVLNDWYNEGGYLSKHLKTLNIEVPNLNERRKFQMETGLLWWEQHFDYIIENFEVTKCRLCDFTSMGTNNSSGIMTKHISEYHNKSISDYITQFPSEEKLWYNKIKRSEKLSNDNSRILCFECNEYFYGLTETHLKSEHGMSINSYKKKWDTNIIFSNDTVEKLSQQAIEINKTSPNHFTSKPQIELGDFIQNELKLSIIYNDKKSLSGVEIDIFIPSKNIGIEYNGLFWHSEKMGKHKTYHLNKTELCEKNNIKLIHIFEDEWLYKSEIVKNRIRHILGCNKNKLYARNCTIKQIDNKSKNIYLNKNHLQGSDKSSILLGAFYDDNLVSVMTFSKPRKSLGYTNKNDETYEMVRFATDGVTGIFSKLLSHFIKTYKPKKIITYADRRWSQGNLYLKMGFKFIDYTKPNYFYTLKYKNRENRFNYRKDILVNEGFDPSLTETEIMYNRGYDKIWDCGSLKFELIIN